MAIPRRTFIQQAGLLSAGLFINPSDFLLKAPEAGLQLWTLREELKKDVKGVMAKVAAAGYADVETFGGGNQFFGLAPKIFKQLLNDHQLISSSGHYYFPVNYQVAKEFDDVILSFMEAANIMQQTYIVIPSLPEALYNTADGCKMAAEKLNRAGELCRSANLQLAYHNHDFEFKQFGTQTGYDILLKETDASLVKMELDLYFAIKAGKDPLALFAKAPGRFALWHIKDMDKSDPALNTEVGSGSINFKKIFAHAQEAGVRRYFIEQENFSMNPFRSIKKSCDFFKKTFR
ncbi:sugar phosphate isomerase/epimerase [Chitinophaga sp. MM2321]|uniref:sugar phosphate isomerase/epimerase family protein n=1 Tax=Chitinophaga sp. MM2321 TaxID=3137178 RepID=UPI0032D5A7CC